MLEIASLIRKQINRGNMTANEGRDLLDDIIDALEPAAWLPELLLPAYELASRLNQSDIFDALGYTTAEALDAEFWTSDRRFANAARQAALGNIRFIG